MITPHHLVYNTTLGKSFFPHWPFGAVLAGALFPDIWVWLFFVWYHLVKGVPQTYLWRELYFKSDWNGVFCLAHSLWLLPLCALLAWRFKKTALLAFFSSALFHALCDFLVHNSDAYRNFYPFSDWRFESPVSYWEPAHFGTWFSMAESLVSIVCLCWWFRRTSNRKGRIFLACLMFVDTLLVLVTAWSFGTLHQH